MSACALARPPATARTRRGDIAAVAVLIVVPLLVFGIPAVLGHLQLFGDNQAQNFPLRVLAGRQLRSGTLPVLNPYIWGGAPLLGGWNAGALYPLTLLFAVLSPTSAWALNVMAVYWVAGLGLYAFLRTVGLRPLPSFLGAGTFAFGGAMQLQLVHLGLVAGMSWIPLILLSLVHLARPTERDGRARWIAVLGAAGGMCVLAGEPRAIDTALIVAIVYALWLCTRRSTAIRAFLVATAVGVAVAILVGAVQWLPGTMAVASSQRAANTYALYSAGSLSPAWLPLLLVPDLLGGAGSFGTPGWFSTFNLPEVTGYVGLMPLVAAVALPVSLRRRRRGDEWPDWVVWELLAVIGIVLALGSYTPLGHVLAHVPLFGGQRIQSRNLAVTDLALAIVLAHWVDGLVASAPAVAPDVAAGDASAPADATLTGASVTGASVPSGARVRLVALVPLAAVVLVSVVALVAPVDLALFLRAPAANAGQATGARPLFAVSLVLALAAAAIVVGATAGGGRRWPVLISAVVVVDLVAFGLTTVWPVATGGGPALAAVGTPSNPSGAARGSPRPPPSLGRTGRFAIFDPTNIDAVTLATLGTPDVNVLWESYSVVGYSSIVDADYARVLGAHAANGQGTNALSPSAIAAGELDQLATTSLLALPRALVVATGPPATGSRGDPSPTGRRSARPGRPARWAFGERLELEAVTLPWRIPVTSTLTGVAAGLRVELVEPGGRTEPVAASVVAAGAAAAVVRLAQPLPAVGLEVASAMPVAFGPPALVTAKGTFTADGVLQDAVGTRWWTFVGTDGPFGRFANERATPPLTVRTPVGTAGGQATVLEVEGPRLAPDAAVIRSTDGAEVVRAVTMIPGWTATWQPRGGGSAEALPVRRHGLVQSVRVPPGTGTVTWHYRAPGLVTGFVATTLGGVAVVVLLVLARFLANDRHRRRRRRGGGRDRAGSTATA
jgi:hypothetical protein